MTSSKMRSVPWRRVTSRRPARNPGRSGSRAHEPPLGSRITAATSPRCRRMRSTSSRSLAARHHRAEPEARREPDRRRHVEGRREAGHELVAPAVEMALEAEDRRAARVGARHPAGQHVGLGARVREAHPLAARHQRLDLLGPLDLERVVVAEVGAERRRLDDGLDDRGVGVAEEEGAVPEVVVDVPVAVDVPLVGALGPRDVGGERQRVPHVVAEGAPDRLLGPRVPRSRADRVAWISPRSSASWSSAPRSRAPAGFAGRALRRSVRWSGSARPRVSHGATRRRLLGEAALERAPPSRPPTPPRRGRRCGPGRRSAPSPAPGSRGAPAARPLPASSTT